MNEWLKKFTSSTKERWSKWTPGQKAIFFGIIAAAVVAVVCLFAFSSKETSVKVFSVPITDEDARYKIISRMNEEGVQPSVSADGIISVKDEATARRMRSILVSEDLVPGSVDPFALFDVTSWSRNDFKDSVDWQRSIQNLVRQQVESLAEVRQANVSLAMPEDKLFASQQNPVTASVVVQFMPGSDFAGNKAKVRSLQRLVMRAVEGLKAENISIVDMDSGEEINDFEGMQASQEVDIIGKQQKMIQRQEAKYRADILSHLMNLYGSDRVRDLSVKVEMDFSKRISDKTEHSAIQIKPDNPDTPYDDSEYRDSIPLSFESVKKDWEGTGYNPEGPAGVEGQNPPVYSDMTNVLGHSREEGLKQNNAVNVEQIHSELVPVLGKRTVSVNIDGVWKKKRDDKGNYVIENGGIAREYVKVSAEELADATSIVQGAIGYDRSRGDIVSVTNIQIDRTAEFEKEDEAYFAKKNRNLTIMLALGGVLLVLVIFIVFRAVSREIERRKRLREEELLRQQQLAREAALAEANAQGMDVTMSVEERRRAELQENAIALAKEHPEDVAMLIRTWLMEE